MLKTVKIIVITFILSLCTFSYVQAMDINMNLSNTSGTSNSTLNSTSNSNLTANSNFTSYSSDDYSVSLSTIPEADLGLSNILNIILIVVGVLLILLAIAIMIRLK